MALGLFPFRMVTARFGGTAMPANSGAAAGLAGEGPGEGAMTTLVTPRESQTPIERVRPGSRPAAPDLAVQIEGRYHASVPTAGVAQPHRGLVRVQAEGPSPERIGIWAALLAKIFGPAATQRERTRREAYQERLKGYGTLNRFSYPRC